MEKFHCQKGSKDKIFQGYEKGGENLPQATLKHLQI